MNFNETMKTGLIGATRLPKLKGHIKIRLHNPTTGKTEVHEGDNMITNALRDIFAANYCGAADYRQFLPLWSKMLGGVLLFGNQLDISSEGAADDYYIPDEGVNPLIAHAGQTAFDSQADDVKRGNPLDSGTIIADGAVTLAWEWGSSGGNGLIRSLGLTHANTGDAGTGANSNAFAAMTPVINAQLGLGASRRVFFIDAEGYGYNFTISGANLTFNKFPVGYQKCGLVAQAYNFTSNSKKTQTIEIGTSYSGFPCFAFDKETSKLYLFYNTYRSTSVNVDVIDFSDWDNIVKSHAVWNNLEASVGPFSFGGNYAAPMVAPLSNGYVYFHLGYNNAAGFLKVRLNSTADQTVISGSFKATTGVHSPDRSGRVIAGQCFVINNGVCYPTAISSPDIVAAWSNYNEYFGVILDQGGGLSHLNYLNSGNNNLYYVSTSKFYLASKYNLSTPVQKTTSQNMVVTYTLTEVEEES